MKPPYKFKPYTHPAGGWGSLHSVGRSLTHERVPFSGARVLLHQNKAKGFACVSCSWAKPAGPHPFEFCAEGAKATAWEITSRRCGPDFFAANTVTELEQWSDHALEESGRLTHPLRYNPASDKYVPVSWEDAVADIADALREYDREKVVFYSSGRASLETSYMYALFARMYGNNNLPDSSNMCHESTSVGLPLSIGVPVGTVTLPDFEKTQCLFFIGHNSGVNSPRILHPLQECAKRGVPILVFNPLHERGFERFTNPQNPVEMLSGASTPMNSQYHQIRVGGDKAALIGVCKALFEIDDAAVKAGHPDVIDRDFIAEHTQGFEDFEACVRGHDWPELERGSGLTQSAMEAAATVYALSEATIIAYGMGMTQHVHGVENVQLVVNLLLMRGNIGKPGAGVLPIRGHSNVQGQRTVGITEKPELVPAQKLEELYEFDPPTKKGLNCVETAGAVLKGDVQAIVQLGGNLMRALPDLDALRPAWRKLRLTVQIETKLNKSCLIHGEKSYVLPCLGRIEIDQQRGGVQAVSVEDSTACIHGSRGYAKPASPELRSEPWIVAALAKRTLRSNSRVDWEAWVANYAEIRDAIERTYPEMFKDFNKRMWEPGGFHRPLPACRREWKTKTGKANFISPKTLTADVKIDDARRDVFQLSTFRSQGQFNTTIYSYRDRFRGVEGTRMALFINKNDAIRLGLHDGDLVSLKTAIGDDAVRRVDGFIIHVYDIPEGCLGGYFPECNPLIPLWHHAEGSFVPASKGVPVTIELA